MIERIIAATLCFSAVSTGTILVLAPAVGLIVHAAQRMPA